MEKSESLKNIGKALMLFHSKVEKVKKDATNPYFNKKYVTLSNILDNILLPLAESGLSFSQLPDGENLITILIHNESGEFFQSSYPIKPAKSDPQGVGSAITYARRYALSAILGISVEEDDDANAATGKEQPVSNGQAKTNGQQAQVHTPGKIEPNPAANADGDTRPWLSEKAYESAVERINNGEVELLDKIKKEFRMKKTYREALEDCAKLQTSLQR